MPDIHKTTDTTALLFFWLVDGTDGINPENGEDGGQPDISINGGAFSPTGVGTLSLIGNGHYTALVDLVVAGATKGDEIVGRYKSANTAEAPSLNKIVAADFDQSTQIEDYNLDHLLAAAAIGTDVADDSIIAQLASKVTTADWDSFNNETDSLEALRDFFQREGLAQTASSYDRTTTTGRMLQTIRQLLDEPEALVKYTDEQLLSYARAAWSTVIQDILNVADNPIVLRLDIAVSSTTQEYVLPPIVGEILQLAKIDPDSDLSLWESISGSRWNPAGPGFLIEGNIIRFTPKWTEAHTLRLTFIPTGDMIMHSGDTTVHSSTTITMDDSPTTGALDLRENAYSGSILRLLSATWATADNHIQERVISSYDATTRIATVSPAFNPVPAAGTVTYEVVPMIYNLLEMVVCYFTATLLLPMEAPPKKQAAVETKYAQMLRALKLRMANIENRTGDRFEHDTPENRNYSPWALGFWS